MSVSPCLDTLDVQINITTGAKNTRKQRNKQITSFSKLQSVTPVSLKKFAPEFQSVKMSIKSKDLSYDTSNEPAFLRRLRAQNSGQGDRHERPVARPQRLQKDTEDDDPTYVVEGSDETLTKAEYDAFISSKSKVDSEKADGDVVGVTGELTGSEPEVSGALPYIEEDEAEAEKKKKRVVEAGAGSKKRKVAKVVGDDGEDGGNNDGDENKGTKSVSKKARKKGKPIKLSFEDE